MDHKKHQRGKYGPTQLHLPPKNHNGGFRTPGLVGQKLIFQNLSCYTSLEAEFNADYFLQKDYGPKINS